MWHFRAECFSEQMFLVLIDNLSKCIESTEGIHMDGVSLHFLYQIDDWTYQIYWPSLYLLKAWLLNNNMIESIFPWFINPESEWH